MTDSLLKGLDREPGWTVRDELATLQGCVAALLDITKTASLERLPYEIEGLRRYLPKDYQ